MKKDAGYSLLEVLIAMTILMLGIVAVYRLFPMSMSQARMAEEKIVVSELADSRMNWLRAAGAKNLLVTAYTVYELYNRDAFTFSGAHRLEQAQTMYESYYTSVQRMAGASDVYLQRVTFMVDMPDGRRESFVTYVVEQ